MTEAETKKQTLFENSGRGYYILSKHKLADGTFFFHAQLTYTSDTSEKHKAENKQADEANPNIINFPMRGV